MSDGEFLETLPCGGKLTVQAGRWSIEYYFPGPDLRYRGDFFSIRGQDLGDHIDNLIITFRKYQELLDAFDDGEEFVKQAQMGMAIRVGGYRPGVCVQPYHLCMSTTQRLEEVVEGYKYALMKGPKVQALLLSI